MSTYALIYVAAISILAVILTVHDKNAARKKAWRIRERTLLTVSIFGGSAAMLLTMFAVRHKTRHKKFMLGIPLIIVVQVAIIVFALNTSLSVSRYTIETDKINGQIKLVLVTDLHSCDYGDGQSELINAIDAKSPDIVLLCGDIFDDRKPSDNARQFISGIADKYACYYVSGNHDTQDEYKIIAESYNVKVLEGTSEVLEYRGEKIRIAGIDDPDVERYKNAGRITSRSEPYAKQIGHLSEKLTDNGLFTVILSHRPERIYELLPLNPDLVLSGHAHGGQWRLPLLLENGLLSPNQGWFPKYTNGVYSFDDTTLLVSRGLAKESTRVIPRIFNRPEIVVITLKGLE